MTEEKIPTPSVDTSSPNSFFSAARTIRPRSSAPTSPAGSPSATSSSQHSEGAQQQPSPVFSWQLTSIPDPLITIRNATKTYGKGETQVHALDAVNLDIARGTMTAIMGPSGSGKSTLLHCIAGLETLTEGQILLDEDDLSTMTERGLTRLRRDRIGFVFQSFNLVPTLNARENITLPMDIARRKVSQNRLNTVVKAVGLEDRLGHMPAELSGGQQQRVACARALLANPAVVFADEPTGNLDSTAANQVLGFLRASVDHLGQSVVLVTHEPAAAAYAHRVIFLADGRIVAELINPTRSAILEAQSAIAQATRNTEGPLLPAPFPSEIIAEGEPPMPAAAKPEALRVDEASITSMSVDKLSVALNDLEEEETSPVSVAPEAQPRRHRSASQTRRQKRAQIQRKVPAQETIVPEETPEEQACEPEVTTTSASLPNPEELSTPPVDNSPVETPVVPSKPAATGAPPKGLFKKVHQTSQPGTQDAPAVVTPPLPAPHTDAPGLIESPPQAPAPHPVQQAPAPQERIPLAQRSAPVEDSLSALSVRSEIADTLTRPMPPISAPVFAPPQQAPRPIPRAQPAKPATPSMPAAQDTRPLPQRTPQEQSPQTSQPPSAPTPALPQNLPPELAQMIAQAERLLMESGTAISQAKTRLSMPEEDLADLPPIPADIEPQEPSRQPTPAEMPPSAMDTDLSRVPEAHDDTAPQNPEPSLEQQLLVFRAEALMDKVEGQSSSLAAQLNELRPPLDASALDPTSPAPAPTTAGVEARLRQSNKPTDGPVNPLAPNTAVEG